MGHGTHWQAVLKDFDEDFAGALDLGIQKGEVIGKRHYTTWMGPFGIQAADVTLIQSANSGFGTLGIVVTAHSKTYLHSAFPIAAKGVVHRLHILEIHESSFGLEASITAQIGAAVINFFDPHYALHFDVYRPNTDLDVSLAGIAYLLSVAKRGETVLHPEIGETHLDGAAMLVPVGQPETSALPANGFGLSYIHAQQNGPALADHHFRGPVKHVASVDFLTRAAWRITATLIRLDDSQNDIDINLYVLDQKIREGQRPSLGCDITGVLWLQGTVGAF